MGNPITPTWKRGDWVRGRWGRSVYANRRGTVAGTDESRAPYTVLVVWDENVYGQMWVTPRDVERDDNPVKMTEWSELP